MATHHKNERYFDSIDTPEKAYFLGLIYADGSNDNGKRLVLRLKTSDKGLLEQLSRVIFGKVHLHHAKPYSTYSESLGCMLNSSGSYALIVSSVYMMSRLEALGVTPRKSLTIGFPDESQVPKHLLRHFIRGYNDGDGCIDCAVDGTVRRFRVSIIGTEQFCRRLAEVASEIGCRFVLRRQQKMVVARMSGNRQVERFLDWIYHDADIFLDRKHATYLELKNTLSEIGAHKFHSSHRNITYDKQCKRWIARARMGGKTVYVGKTMSEAEAFVMQQAFIARLGMATNQDEQPSVLSPTLEAQEEPRAFEAA